MKQLKAVGAVLAGFITVVVLSVGMDLILESLVFFPPQDQPEAYTGWMLMIAFVYRSIATVVGGYTTARLAPDRPMRSVVILGILGTVGATVGAIVGWNLTPHNWYPVSLAVFALPCAWVGGRIVERKRSAPVVS